MKGREWYQASDVAERYEDKRFSGGGRLIDDRERRAVLDAIGDLEDARVLEIACGTGRFSVELAARGATVVGLDISEPMLREGRRKAADAELSGSLEYLRGDAAQLPFRDEEFDAVLAMRFFHLADRPATFLREMARVARERVVFDTFNGFSARTAYNWLLPMGSRLYSRGEVRDLVDRAGLGLAGAEHDFVVPYGLYRKLPGRVAAPLRRADRALVETGPGERLTSVSYWRATV